MALVLKPKTGLFVFEMGDQIQLKGFYRLHQNDGYRQCQHDDRGNGKRGYRNIDMIGKVPSGSRF